MGGISIFNIIINKPYYKKKPCLIILFKVDKGLKINLIYIILSLNLAVYL